MEITPLKSTQMKDEIKAGNIRMAEFMEITHRTIYEYRHRRSGYRSEWISKGGFLMDDWDPHSDLNQLMKVVDKICEDTGWVYELRCVAYIRIIFFFGPLSQDQSHID